MSLIEQSNRSLRTLGLPHQILVILACELGWINVLDVLNFLRHKHPSGESRASYINALEVKLIGVNGIGTKTVKKIVDTFITNGII